MEATAMKVQIDGTDHPFNFAEDAVFEDIMQGVSEAVAGNKAAITNVNMNGEDITGKDWDEFSGIKATDIHNLNVQTGDMNTLALDTLLSLDDFIGNLISELRKSTEHFRLGDEVKGGDAFSRSIDGIQIVNHTTALIQRSIGISDVDSGEDNLADHVAKLQPIIEDILTAQTDHDWVLLADLVEYELIPYFDKHRNIIAMWKNINV